MRAVTEGLFPKIVLTFVSDLGGRPRFRAPVPGLVSFKERNMQANIQRVVENFQQSVSANQGLTAINTTVYLLLGGCAALYVRLLYQKFSAAASDTDSITRVFPLLLMVTTAVIAVVKSSLALSLGLVGALSIVRFRAAIKDPEELVYLFLCIAIGLALGAEQPFLALGLMGSATIFVVGMHLTGRSSRDHKLLLTIRGNADAFGDDENGVLSVVQQVIGGYSLHRFDLENDRGQLRVTVGRMTPAETAGLIVKLRQKLPDCEFSYVNMNSAV